MFSNQNWYKTHWNLEIEDVVWTWPMKMGEIHSKSGLGVPVSLHSPRLWGSSKQLLHCWLAQRWKRRRLKPDLRNQRPYWVFSTDISYIHFTWKAMGELDWMRWCSAPPGWKCAQGRPTASTMSSASSEARLMVSVGSDMVPNGAQAFDTWRTWSSTRMGYVYILYIYILCVYIYIYIHNIYIYIHTYIQYIYIYNSIYAQYIYNISPILMGKVVMNHWICVLHVVKRRTCRHRKYSQHINAVDPNHRTTQIGSPSVF